MRFTPRVSSLVTLATLISATSMAQVVIATVPVGLIPTAVAVNPATNKTYVANYCGNGPSCEPPLSPGTLTAIDGLTLATQTVAVGYAPSYLAINSITNKIYVVNACGGDHNCQGNSTVTVIDGQTLITQTVAVGPHAYQVAVNPVTNKIYVAIPCNDPGCRSGGSLTVIDGVTLSNQTIPIAGGAGALSLNAVTNKIYVTNGAQSTITVIDGTTLLTQTVDVGIDPIALAVNTVMNKIYVADCADDNSCHGGVTVVDGITLSTQRVTTGYYPFNVVINAITNKIYVVNQCGDDENCESVSTVTAVDGNTLGTQTVPVGWLCCEGQLGYAAVNSVTNKIYVPVCNDLQCVSPGVVTTIDGVTLSTSSIAAGSFPGALDLNASTNRIYVAVDENDIAVIGGDTKLQLASVTPCRLVDTRAGDGGPIPGGASRTFNLPQLAQAKGCANLSSAAAYSLNVTLVPQGGRPVGYLTLWPAGESRPMISTMNSPDGRIKANAAVVPAGASGGVNVYVTNTADVILDIDGYFAPSTASTLTFYPLPPCRIVDTRGADGDLGGPYLQGQLERDFPIPASTCLPLGITPVAYSFNVTALPHPAHQHLGYLTVWATGEQQPVVSTLNNPTGTNVANAAIVPAGTDGSVAVYPSNDTDLLIDIDGYFSAPGSGGLSLYTVTPCRVLDTRGVGSGQPFQGELTVNVTGSPCSPPSAAQAYVFNATVVPPGALGYLTLWPNGQDQPVVSTLNAGDGAITSNMAIVPNVNGSIDAYASALTQLILDISGYFAP